MRILPSGMSHTPGETLPSTPQLYELAWTFAAASWLCIVDSGMLPPPPHWMPPVYLKTLMWPPVPSSAPPPQEASMKSEATVIIVRM